MRESWGFGILFGVCGVFLIAVEGAGDEWGNIDAVLRGDLEGFDSLVKPLAHMTLLTYTATKGSYFKEGAKKQGVEGFERDDHLSKDPESGGVRAIVFVHKDSGPVVIAFRGTDLDSTTRGGQADSCVNRILGYRELPSFCDDFSEEELDYYDQASQVVGATLKKFPRRHIVLTGHSLGCGLSGMMAHKFRKRNVTGVCFSMPGVLGYVSERTRVPQSKIKKIDNFYVLSDSNDPVIMEAVINNGFFGQLFLWKTPKSKACCECCTRLKMWAHAGSIEDLKCKICFLEAHVFKNYYVNLVGNPDIQPEFSCQRKCEFSCSCRE